MRHGGSPAEAQTPRCCGWLLLLALLAILPAPAVAIATDTASAAPQVATDIAPVHSLVSAIMAGVATPELLLRKPASAHHYSLRVSDARRLRDSEVFFWIGPGLTPWLQKPLGSLATSATQVALLQQPATLLLPQRQQTTFASVVPDSTPADAVSQPDTTALANSRPDPHAWLDPRNAIAWAETISGVLSERYPRHRQTFEHNATRLIAELEILDQQLQQVLVASRQQPALIYHDAYQYFTQRYQLPTLAAIVSSDDQAPGPAQVGALRDLVQQHRVGCVITEPGHSTRLIDSIVAARHRAASNPAPLATIMIDPMGTSLPLGATLYPQLLRHIAQAFTDCVH